MGGVGDDRGGEPRKPGPEKPVYSRREALRAVAKYSGVVGGAAGVVLTAADAVEASSHSGPCNNPGSGRPPWCPPLNGRSTRSR